MQKGLIRILDILLALLALLVFSPVLLIICTLVAVKMGTPIFFTQQRVGMKGKIFVIYKFRSMVDDMIVDDGHLEKVNEYAIKYKNDPRITPLGAFLRCTSLDELPQFLNVLLGDMSFIGPRPWVAEEYQNLPKKWHYRLNAKPGITGLAQINGRSELPMDKIVENDILWIEKQTIRHYFEVLFKTFVYVFKMKNAY
jgi:lipopolysaccharide/colanic/teichoic acid biosynthesis glycosyltransferase